MVEMAVFMPVILMLLLGVFTFSLTIYQKLALAEAVSTGGRFLSIDRGDTDPCSSTTSKIKAVSTGITQSKMTFTYTLNGVVTNGTTCPGSGGLANANMVSGANAQVSVSYPCNLISFPAFGNTFNTTCSLKSTIVEVIQ
jgi:Flp pilus assembly protein TadG